MYTRHCTRYIVHLYCRDSWSVIPEYNWVLFFLSVQFFICNNSSVLIYPLLLRNPFSSRTVFILDVIVVRVAKDSVTLFSISVETLKCSTSISKLARFNSSWLQCPLQGPAAGCLLTHSASPIPLYLGFLETCPGVLHSGLSWISEGGFMYVFFSSSLLSRISLNFQLLQQFQTQSKAPQKNKIAFSWLSSSFSVIRDMRSSLRRKVMNLHHTWYSLLF